jgi:hypothetical protein
MDRAPYEAWRGKYGGTLLGTCIDLGRRGRRGDDGGEPPRVEVDPGSCERSPSMAPRIRPCLVLVGESTGTNALRCLKLRSCLSSTPAEPRGDPGVDSSVSEDRKNQLGVRGVCECDAAARGVASLPSCSFAATASLGPGLVVRLLRTPHFLTDPIRDKMEDRLLLDDSEGERSAGAAFGVLGWGGEGKGVEAGSLSRSSKTLLSGGRDFFRRRLRPFWAGGLGGNMSEEAPPPRKGRCATDEYVAESRPEGTEKTDMVGEPGKASPGDGWESGRWGSGGGGENLARASLRGCAVTVLSSSWSSSSSDESHVGSFLGDRNLPASMSSSQFSGSGISGSLRRL